MQVSMVMHSVLSKWLGCSSSKAMIHRKKHGSIKPTRRKRSTTVLSLNLSVGAYRLNRNFLGAIVTHMWVLSPFSLIQNRTGDFGAPFAHLRGSALQPSTQVRASVLASTCVWDRLHLGISPMIFLLSHFAALCSNSYCLRLTAECQAVARGWMWA